MGMEIEDKVFVGNDAGFLDSLYTLSDFNVDIATRVSNGQWAYSTSTSFRMSLRWIRMYWKLSIELLR